jgi:hypothetical protein
MKITRKKSKLFTKDIQSHTMNFAAIIQNSSRAAIDNISIASKRLISSCMSPTVNCLSDNDAQFLTIINITTKLNSRPLKQRSRRVSNETIAQVLHLLENEMWEYKL